MACLDILASQTSKKELFLRVGTEHKFLHQSKSPAIFGVRNYNFLAGRFILLAEEFTVIESDSPFWLSSSSLLDIVKRFNEQDEAYSWNGWNKQQIRD